MHQVQEEEPAVATVMGIDQGMMGFTGSGFVGWPRHPFGVPPGCLYPKIGKGPFTAIAEALRAWLVAIVVGPPEFVAPGIFIHLGDQEDELPSAATNTCDRDIVQVARCQSIEILHSHLPSDGCKSELVGAIPE